MAKKAGMGRKLFSLGAALLVFAVGSALVVLIFDGIAERDKLVSRNGVERTWSLLLAGLRDHEDFGSAIESSKQLQSEIVGIAAYAEGGRRIYSWGATPDTFTMALPLEDASGLSPRLYLDKSVNDSIVFLSRPFRAGPPPPPTASRARPAQAPGREGRAPPSGFLFTTLRNAELLYLEIKEPSYWRSRRAESLLFPLVEVALAALIVFVSILIRRNAEYRLRIEEQKNLVVLGTAASTLAHEIKNPLSSIKLQARILEKTYPSAAKREIGIINDEVERLSNLSHRVGDYLRDPAGNPQSIDPADIALEVGMRLCGRNILRVLAPPPPKVRMDPERLRSVLENLLRNAIEAEGPEEGLSIEAREEGGSARLDVLDRGAGLGPEASSRLFDPFFTTKSRGTGIGLPICRRFVEAAGGTVVLSRRAGGGCAARLLLPADGASA
jgi:two-component system sensor histidine kinase HydH